jgi:hypothetical protein
VTRHPRGREESIYPARSPVPSMTSKPAKAPASRTLHIPEDVAVALEERIKGSSFESLDAFVAFVLARLAEQSGESAFSEEDERALKDRLRSLGYID